jgi:hypothetical protein
MKILDIPKSGRDGRCVYYMRDSNLCRRKYVVPKDPRTTGQLRARAALTAASKAWSHHPQLTEEHRRDWRVAGAKVRSRPRLYQSGPLTGQMYFVARNCSRDRAGRDLLLRATDPVGQSSAGRRQPVEAASQGPQCQRVARSTWGQYRIYTGHTPSQYRPSTLRHSKAGRAVPSAPRACKHARNVRNWATYGGARGTARPTQDRFGQYTPLRPCKVRWSGHWRELWHGT